MDVLGFTLQYEMSYTDILDMLDLSGIPLLAKDRDESFPLVIAGGPCAFTPEPLADFIDVFLIGDGEELLPAFLEKLRSFKNEGRTREEFLNLLRERLASTDINAVKADVEPFVINPRELEIWSNDYFLQLADRVSFQ